MNGREQQAIREMEERMPDIQQDNTDAEFVKPEKPVVKTRFLFHDIYPRSFGIIESNHQIVRNESGQAKHKEFTGVYKESLKNTSDSPHLKSHKPVHWLVPFTLWFVKMVLLYFCLKYLLRY